MNCKNCLDTGHSNVGMSQYLDCIHCEAATLRANLNDQFPLAAKLYPDSLWGAYKAGADSQRARIAELERARIAELEREVAANREKITAAVESDLAAHRKLAGETLRANQGWQRYEEKNRECNAPAPAALTDDIWSLIDAYANARAEYMYSTERHLGKQQRENKDYAKAEIERAFATARAAPAEQARDALNEACRRACGNLPDDYNVRIELEHGAGWVEWTRGDAEWHQIDGDGYLSSDVDEAVETAITDAAAIASQQKGDDHA